MIKRLVKHGNSRAIVIDKGLLASIGLPEDAPFQITINPNGGLLIESVDDAKTELFEENFQKLNKKYKNLMQSLADK